MTRIVDCPGCGERKKHGGKGLCKRCYDAQRNQIGAGRTIKCVSCGQHKLHGAHGLCCRCYATLRRRRRGIPVRRIGLDTSPCRWCGEASGAKARGLCLKCYEKLRRRALKIFAREKLRRVGKKRWQQIQEQTNRTAALERYGYKCAICQIPDAEHKEQFVKALAVHHLDGNGFVSAEPNNSLENLMVLCTRCHMKLHADQRAGRSTEYVNEAIRSIESGSTDRP